MLFSVSSSELFVDSSQKLFWYFSCSKLFFCSRCCCCCSRCSWRCWLIFGLKSASNNCKPLLRPTKAQIWPLIVSFLAVASSLFSLWSESSLQIWAFIFSDSSLNSLAIWTSRLYTLFSSIRRLFSNISN